jgi:hypothetical protein
MKASIFYLVIDMPPIQKPAHNAMPNATYRAENARDPRTVSGKNNPCFGVPHAFILTHSLFVRVSSILRPFAKTPIQAGPCDQSLGRVVKRNIAHEQRQRR